MDQDLYIPRLFSYYFGDSAASAYRGASRRLKKWSRAFEQWMDERRQNYKKSSLRQSTLAWRRLVRQCRKMPWEIRQADIEQHIAWMEQQGLSMGTVLDELGIIASFYRWSDERRVDRLCASGFNPAAQVKPPRPRPYAGTQLLSWDELQGLLTILKRDPSILGQREYAFFLARLSLGVPLNSLRRLKWEQIEGDEAGAWVKWREELERVRLPDPLWQAMRAYLQASGRLEGMRAGKYIFAPLAAPGTELTGAAGDWLEDQPLSSSVILGNLKLYGRRVGITETRLTLEALRRTAIRLKLDDGESLPGMKIFLDSRVNLRDLKYRLGCLPELPEGNTLAEPVQTNVVEVPERKAKPFKEGENTTHGFYTCRKDRQAVSEVLAENIQGMDEESACLRKLMRGLLEREGDEAPVVEAYSQAAQRLGALITSSEIRQGEKEDPLLEEYLSTLDEFSLRHGGPPISQQLRLHALGLSPEDGDAAGMATEEIATIRYLLRNVYRRAMQGIETREYVHLVDLYGLGCTRLARLLKVCAGDENGRVLKYLQNMLNKAIRQLTEEWGLGRDL